LLYEQKQVFLKTKADLDALEAAGKISNHNAIYGTRRGSGDLNAILKRFEELERQIDYDLIGRGDNISTYVRKLWSESYKLTLKAYSLLSAKIATASFRDAHIVKWFTIV
jgi:hypothetical protein